MCVGRQARCKLAHTPKLFDRWTSCSYPGMHASLPACCLLPLCQQRASSPSSKPQLGAEIPLNLLSLARLSAMVRPWQGPQFDRRQMLAMRTGLGVSWWLQRELRALSLGPGACLEPDEVQGMRKGQLQRRWRPKLHVLPGRDYHLAHRLVHGRHICQRLPRCVRGGARPSRQRPACVGRGIRRAAPRRCLDACREAAAAPLSGTLRAAPRIMQRLVGALAVPAALVLCPHA